MIYIYFSSVGALDQQFGREQVCIQSVQIKGLGFKFLAVRKFVGKINFVSRILSFRMSVIEQSDQRSIKQYFIRQFGQNSRGGVVLESIFLNLKVFQNKDCFCLGICVLVGDRGFLDSEGRLEFFKVGEVGGFIQLKVNRVRQWKIGREMVLYGQFGLVYQVECLIFFEFLVLR